MYRYKSLGPLENMVCSRTQEKSNRVGTKKAVYRILGDKAGKGGRICTIQSIIVSVKDFENYNSILQF